MNLLKLNVIPLSPSLSVSSTKIYKSLLQNISNIRNLRLLRLHMQHLRHLGHLRHLWNSWHLHLWKLRHWRHLRHRPLLLKALSVVWLSKIVELNKHLRINWLLLALRLWIGEFVLLKGLKRILPI